MNRSKYKRINKVRNQTHYYPIFHWKEWEVWEFIEKYKLKYPKLYDLGFSRIGCILCPNGTRHETYREMFPNYFKCFEKYVKMWWYKRRDQGRIMWHETPEDFINDWYNGKFYYYKKK